MRNTGDVPWSAGDVCTRVCLGMLHPVRCAPVPGVTKVFENRSTLPED